LKNFERLNWSEVVEVKVWGINARGDGGFVVPWHVLFDVGEGNQSGDDFVNWEVRRS
jgi:hypothetical protein